VLSKPRLLRAKLQRWTRLSAWFFLLLGNATAYAQRPTAREHLTAAHDAEKRRDWAGALAHFAAAEDLENSIEALRGIADTHYRMAHDGEAYNAYEALLRNLAQIKISRVRRRALEQTVADRLRELSARTGVIAVAVTEPGADVHVDNQSFGVSPANVVLHVSVGSHRVRAEKPDGSRAEQAVDVEAGTNSVVELHFPPAEPPSKTPVEPVAPQEPVTAPSPLVAAPGKDAWDIPHGSVRYTAFRARIPPKIDGSLDDPVWRDAPRDSHFLSKRSKPYGQPSTEPTTVQVAYDDEYLYVGVTCTYSSSRPRDDSFSTDEQAVLAEAERFTVAIDPLHDHANVLLFGVSRVGARVDDELTQSGVVENLDWRGIWDVATRHRADEWSAEFRIPWGTLRLPRRDGPFAIGIQFHRREPAVGESALWSLETPGAPGELDPNYFGHLEGLDHVRPTLRLYLQPYASIAYDQQAGALRSRLSDFIGTQSNFRTYAGLYARYYPPGPLRFEATINPDFAATPPDQAVANFDRFELLYPEVRPFFAEDKPRFQFGADTAQLFYSRRVGLDTNPQTGATTAVPILYGGKAIVRTGGTEVAALNAALSTPDPRISFADNIGVVRLNQSFPGGSRIGNILIGRIGPTGNYAAGGVDGTLGLYDRHLTVSGLLARTATEGHAGSGMGQAQVDWTSEDLFASTSYMDIGTAFDAQLGYFPITGIRSNFFSAGYTPVLRNDLVQQLSISGSLNLTRDRSDVRIYDRGTIDAFARLINGGIVEVTAMPAIENVLQSFPLFAGRLTVPAGQYDVMVLQANVSSAIRRPVVVALGYLAGDLFGGQRQSPSVNLGLNLGPWSSNALYELFIVRYGSQEFVGHQVSGTASISYTPLAKSTLVVQANTLIERAVAQLVTSYTFGLLSTVSLVLVRTTGVNVVPTNQWVTGSSFSAILSLAYGISPF
jgi:hypothetical protein